MTTATSVPTQAPVSNEQWGGFVLVAPGATAAFTRTPAPAGEIPDEELIPADHPGTQRFDSRAQAVSSGKVAAALAVEPSDVPPLYALAGVYVVDVPGPGVVDYALSYRRTDLPRRSDRDELFGPDLWIGWTTRAPRPLTVPSTAQDLGQGRVAKPYEKVTVRGFQGVVVVWTNPKELHRSLRISSALTWFDDDGRFWFVHAETDRATLLDIAERLQNAPRR